MTRKRKTALVIDDDPLIRLSIHEVLESVGFTVWEAENGRQGMALLRRYTGLDLIVTDILMPEEDGVEFLLHVKQLDVAAGRRPKIIAISGGGAFADAGFYLESTNLLGADVSLTKPFSSDDLVDALATLDLLAPSEVPT